MPPQPRRITGISTALRYRRPPKVWTLKWVADNGDMSTSADSGPNGFDLIFEVEPATRPDLTGVRHQIGVMSRTATAFLIPDNHIGRATVSSIAVAHEVALMGGRAIACLNARDRNQLGFRRDLLTADAYGVNDFLFVYGDRPESGARSDDLTVRLMLVGMGVSLVCALLLTQSARLLQFWELLYVVGGFTALLLSIQMHTLRRRTTVIDLR